MTKREFHNALRILLNIDAREFVAAVYGGEVAVQGEVRADWEKFRDNPWRWFISAPDGASDAVWGIVEARKEKRPA